MEACRTAEQSQNLHNLHVLIPLLSFDASDMHACTTHYAIWERPVHYGHCRPCWWQSGRWNSSTIPRAAYAKCPSCSEQPCPLPLEGHQMLCIWQHTRKVWHLNTAWTCYSLVACLDQNSCLFAALKYLCYAGVVKRIRRMHR